MRVKAGIPRRRHRHDILAMILADTSDTRDLLKLFLWQAERHADILVTIVLEDVGEGVGVGVRVGVVECQLLRACDV